MDWNNDGHLDIISGCYWTADEEGAHLQILKGQGDMDFDKAQSILNVAGEDQRFVFQGVHMLFDGRADRPWKADETRKNELVFIGRNLDEAQLKQEFQACLV